MEKLLSVLRSIPEFHTLLESLRRSESAAITGIGQINRSHMIAALHREISRPLVIICQDDIAAKRMQEELKCFMGDPAPVLPNRELTLYDAAVVSRAWEQKRIRQDSHSDFHVGVPQPADHAPCHAAPYRVSAGGRQGISH